VCIALNHYVGAHFTRVSVYCGDVSYFATWSAIDQVIDALCAKYEENICFTKETEMEATAQRIEERFYLPRFAYAVDGMLVRFDVAPRGVLAGPGFPNHQNLFTRKID
jgi:hypothetical protein